MSRVSRNFLWIYHKCKTFIPFIILIIAISSTLSLASVGKAMVSKLLIDSAITQDSGQTLKWLVILFSILLLQIILSASQTIFNTYCSEKIKNNLQKSLYSHIINSKWQEFNKFHSVELLTIITNDINTIINMLCNIIPQIFALIFMLVSSFIALLSLSKTMALVAISIFPFLIILSKIYGKKLRKFYIQIQQKEVEYNRFIQESFNNILILKSFCLEKNRIKTLKHIQTDRLNLSIKRSYFSCVSNGLLSLSSILGYFSVFTWCSFNLPISGSSIFGSLTAMIQLFDSIQMPIYGLSSSFPQLVSALAATDRLINVENMSLEAINTVNIHESSSEIASTSPININFNNVSFSYDNNKKILDNVSMNISSGETIAIVGPSGEGKTTFIRLLLSLLEVDSGSITINNSPLNSNHRNLISYVPQGDTLFSGSILDNLKVASPYIDEKAINDALAKSCSMDFVDSLPQKVNTIIGENGTGISQGQAQRLSIARAFLRKAPILILDEATSSLDSQTEVNVLNAVKNLEYNPICIIITHRPSALSICDKVYKLYDKKLYLQENTL